MKPFINTQYYEVGFSNGYYHELTANQNAGEMLSHIDDKGRHF